MTDNPDPVWYLTRLLHKTATEDSVKCQMNMYTLPQDQGLLQSHSDKAHAGLVCMDPNTEGFFKRTETNAHMFRGTYYEPDIIEDLCEWRGMTLEEAPLVVDVQNLCEGATADGISYDDKMMAILGNPHSPGTIEAKCPVSVPDLPPLHYVEQSIKQMYIWQISYGYLVNCNKQGHRRVWLVMYHEAFYRWMAQRARSTHHARMMGYLGLHAVSSFGPFEYMLHLRHIDEHMFPPSEKLDAKMMYPALESSMQYWKENVFQAHTTLNPIVKPEMTPYFAGVPMPPIFLIRNEMGAPLPEMEAFVPPCLRNIDYTYVPGQSVS